MTPEQRYFAKIRRQGQKRINDMGLRGLISRSRGQESQVHAQQLTTRSGRQLRILAAGNGAEAEDIGKFWFVPGYSVVGGPDIVPEE